MKVRATKRFKDLKAKCYREEGEVFEVTKTRYKEIKKKKPHLIEDVPEEPQAPTEPPADEQEEAQAASDAE